MNKETIEHLKLTLKFAIASRDEVMEERVRLALGEVERVVGALADRPKHTPGPWVAIGRTVHHLMFEEPLDGRNEICRVPNCNPESERNARLIAAAPELLAALIGCLPTLEDRAGQLGVDSVPLVAARAAISHVEGDVMGAGCPACDAVSNGPVPAYCPEHDGDYSSFLAMHNCD